MRSNLNEKSEFKSLFKILPTEQEIKAYTEEMSIFSAKIIQEERYKGLIKHIPIRYKNADFENFDLYAKEQNNIVEMLKKFIAKFEEYKNKNVSLIFTGKCGTGKTHLAWTIFKKLILTDNNIYYSSLISILDAMTTSAGKTLKQKIEYFVRPDLLIIDEVDFINNNGQIWKIDEKRSLLFEIINTRYELLGKSNILITNHNIEELVKHLGIKTIDRLLENACVFNFNWASFRTLHKGDMNT